jgi:putative flippase GtrA
MSFVENEVSDMTLVWRRETSLKFAVVGLLTAGVFFCLLEFSISKLDLRPVVASSICYVLAVVLNYCMHYYWTYGVSRQHVRSGFRYVVMIFAGFILNMVVMYVGVELLKVHYFKIQILSVATIAAFNYFVATAWVFRHRAAMGSEHE